VEDIDPAPRSLSGGANIFNVQRAKASISNWLDSLLGAPFLRSVN